MCLIMMNQSISMVEGINNPSAISNHTIGDVLDYIKKGVYNGVDLKQKTNAIQQETDHNKQNQMKMGLPVALFTGTFSYKRASNLLSYSGIAVLDYDGFQSSQEMDTLRKGLIQHKNVFALFTTPSGKGLKVLLLTDNTNPSLHGSLMTELFLRFKTPQLDTSVKDLARGHYICYDPNIYINTQAKPYHFAYGQYHGKFQCVASSPGTHSLSKIKVILSTKSIRKVKTDKSIVNILASAFRRDQNARTEGNRANSIFKYSCDFCKAGIEIDDALDFFKAQYHPTGMEEWEVEKHVIGGYSSNINNYGVNRPILDSYGNGKKP